MRVNTSAEVSDTIGSGRRRCAAWKDAAEVCRLLAERQIPFVFYTGRSGASVLFAEWPHVRVLKKPARPADIVSALAGLFRQANR